MPEPGARRGRGYGAAALMLLLAPPLFAGQPMSSPGYSIWRDAADSGGDHLGQSANYKLNGAVAEQALAAVNGSTSSSASYDLGPALMNIVSFPGRVTDLGALAGVSASSATLAWSAPGYDGGLGRLMPGTTYFVRLASYTVPDTFSFPYADISFSTKDTSPGQAVSRGLTGLAANTTYYAALWTEDAAGDLSFMSPRATFTTLALAPQRLAGDYLNVFFDSATLRWAALAQSPPSLGCEGYLLEASTTDFGALFPGGAILSSATPNVLLSTLTVAGLDLGATTYFRVGSLNHNSVPNYTALSRLNMQADASANTLSLGALNAALYASTVSISNIVVTNKGSLPVTLAVWGATVTPCLWTLGLAPGIETVLLQGLWNTVAPPSAAFATPITVTTRTSSAGDYAGDQTGTAVGPGQTRTMWFQFWRPASTLDTAKEYIRVDIRPVYP